jgi:hypothetical protein
MNKPLRLFLYQSTLSVLLLFFHISCAHALEAPQPRPVLHATLSTSDYRLDEEFSLSIEVSWLGKADQWTVVTPRLELINLQLQNVSTSSTTESGRTTKSFIYHLLPLGTGNAQIEHANIFCYAKGNNQPEVLRLNTQQIKIKSRRFKFSAFLKSKVFMGIIAGLLVLFSIFFVRLMKSKKTKNFQSAKISSEEDVFIDELNHIMRNEKETQKQFDQLAHVLKKFLNQKFQLTSPTSLNELTYEIEKTDWTSQEKKWLIQFLKDIQEKQFAGTLTSSLDVSELHDKIVQFIESKRIIHEVS